MKLIVCVVKGEYTKSTQISSYYMVLFVMGSVVSNSTKRRSKINCRTLYQLEIYYSGRVASILSRVHLGMQAGP